MFDNEYWSILSMSKTAEWLQLLSNIGQ